MLTQIGIGEISDKLALAGDGNCSGLLGSDDYHRIALLAHTYGGSVAGSELGIEILFLSQWQDTACGNYPAVADNCGSVMETIASTGVPLFMISPRSVSCSKTIREPVLLSLML